MNITKTGAFNPQPLMTLSMLHGKKEPVPVESKSQGKPAVGVRMSAPVESPPLTAGDMQSKPVPKPTDNFSQVRPTLAPHARQPGAGATVGGPCHGADPVQAPTSITNADSAPPATTLIGGSPLTLEGFDKAWGQGGSEYDVNGDGTVNIDDLVQFITSLSGANPAVPSTPMPAPVEGQPSPSGSIDLIASSADPARKPRPLTLDGLLAAWSSGSGDAQRASSPYDLTGDGLVNIDDLTTFITGLTPGAAHAPGSAPAPAPGLASSTVARQATADTSPKKTEQLITVLMSRLDKMGFANQPPTNIRELIGALDLSPEQTNVAIRQAQQRYPQGLGVNLVG